MPLQKTTFATMFITSSNQCSFIYKEFSYSNKMFSKSTAAALLYKGNCQIQASHCRFVLSDFTIVLRVDY